MTKTEYLDAIAKTPGKKDFIRMSYIKSNVKCNPGDSIPARFLVKNCNLKAKFIRAVIIKGDIFVHFKLKGRTLFETEVIDNQEIELVFQDEIFLNINATTIREYSN